MNIAEIIAAITGGTDPNKAIMDAQGAIPPTQDASASAAPPPSTAPAGVPTPVTNPKPAPAVPQALQSPPDLANMYIQLMKQSQNAAALDAGTRMIAAGLSNSPVNRAALLQGASGGGGMSMSAGDLIALQKQQQAQQDMLIQRAALPALMKQYNMTPAQIQYLQSSGKLDEVMKTYATQTLSSATSANGQIILYDGRTGKHVATLGPEKEEPTQLVTTPAGQQPMGMQTGTLVGQPAPLGPTDTTRTDTAALAAINASLPPDKQMDMKTYLTTVKHSGLGTQINVSPSGAVFDKPETGYAYLRNPDNTVKVDAEGKPQQYRIAGGPAEAEAAKTQKALDDAAIKKGKADVQAVFTASNVGEAVKTAMQHVDKPGVVGLGSEWLRGAPLQPGGLPHNIYDAAVKTIGSNVTIETLNRMRQASPTGGALGNVTNFEDQMLQSVIGPLTTSTSPVEARKGLIRVQAAMEILADDNFNHDPAKFQSALDKRLSELSTKYAPTEAPPKSGITVIRRQ